MLTWFWAWEISINMSENRLIDLKIYMKEMILVKEMLKKKCCWVYAMKRNYALEILSLRKEKTERYPTDHQEHIDQKLVLC